MAMMIAKFHRLIQSRLLWIVFLVVIVFSFVIWGMQSPGQSQDRRQTSPGTLDGKPVPPDEFRAAYRHEYAGMILMFGQGFRSNDEIEAYLRDAAWRRLIGWREAKRLGIQVSDQELLRAIREEPAFQHNGAFSMERYRAFLAHTLGSEGLTEQFFEEYLRGELLTHKLAGMLRLATIVPPAEEAKVRRTLSEILHATAVALGPELVSDSVSVTEEDAQAFFERDSSAYRVPPRVRLRYIQFDAKRHFGDLTGFSEEAVEDYYDLNARAFQRFDFSGAEDGQTPRPVIPPLEEIRDEVMDRMRRDTALTRARSEADQFLRQIAPYATSTPLAFETAAERAGLPVQSSPPVKRGERIPGTQAPLSATQAAFSLQPTPEEYFTEPFAGEDSVYIFALDERMPAFIPDFEEVRDQVMENAHATRVTEALRALGESVQRRVQDGEDMETVAADIGADVHRVQPFTLSTPPDDPFAQWLRASLASLNEGEVAYPLLIPDGRVLVGRLDARQPATAEEAESIPAFDPAEWRNQKANLVFHTWLQGLLERADFSERPRAGQGENDQDLDG